MSDLERRLLEAMLEAGASASCAQIHATRFAAAVGPKIERDRRNRAVRELFPIIHADGVVEHFGVCRATAYNIVGRKSKKVQQG